MVRKEVPDRRCCNTLMCTVSTLIWFMVHIWPPTLFYDTGVRPAVSQTVLAAVTVGLCPRSQTQRLLWTTVLCSLYQPDQYHAGVFYPSLALQSVSVGYICVHNIHKLVKLARLIMSSLLVWPVCLNLKTMTNLVTPCVSMKVHGKLTHKTPWSISGSWSWSGSHMLVKHPQNLRN